MRKYLFIPRLALIPKTALAALMGGAVIAGLNLLLLLWRGEMFYKFRDLHTFFSWHILVWTALGIFLGIILFLLSFIIGKIFHIRARQVMAAAFIVAIFLGILSYLNIYSLGYILSWPAFIINSFGILAMVAAMVISVLKTKNISKYIIMAPGLLCLIIWSSSWISDRAPRFQPQVQKADDRLPPLNILVIVLDAVRANHLGCYGYHRDTSPHIDRLASRGILFTKAFAHAGRTIMSVPSLLTSTYPSTHGVKTNFSCLPKACPTLPAYLHSAGYSTAFFSTNPTISTVFGYGADVDDFYEPIKNTLNRAYFAKFLSTLISATASVNPRLSSFASRLLEGSYELFASPRELLRTQPDYVTSQTISWISQHQASPFFIYAHYEGGHSPYRSPLAYEKHFPPNYQGRRIDDPFLLTALEQEKLLTQEIEHMVALYDAKIKYHDDQLSRLFNYLKATGLDQSTIVVLTADHGEEFGENGYFAHSSLYEEIIRVPLIIYSPRLFPSHRVIDGLIGQVDLLPTLINLSGIANKPKLDKTIEGLDFSAFLLGLADRPQRDYIFSELDIEDRKYGTIEWKSILTLSSQAIQVQSGSNIRRMLFDLASDPQEKRNIYQEYSERGRQLFEIMDSVFKLSVNKSFKAKRTYLDENIKERLKALGYIH